MDLDRSVYGADVGPRLERLAHDRGLIARIGHDFLVFAPPLVTPEATLHRMIDSMDDALAAL